MPELKHGFGAAKMNKDVDERVVPNGEYREALNIEISTSENSDVGTMQTLMGNTHITSSTITANINGKCVGSIVDEQSNNLYYFITDPDNFTDYILQYNSISGELVPIVVDKYEFSLNVSSGSLTNPPSTVINSFKISDLGSSQNITNVRPGMRIQSNDFIAGSNGLVSPFTFAFGVIVVRMDHIGNEWKVYTDHIIPLPGMVSTMFTSGYTTNPGNEIRFQADRALNFKGNQITGINIIDGIIYWTDGVSEPKRIIVENFTKDIIPGKAGTDPSGEFHSFFNVYSRDNTLLEDNIAAIDFRQRPNSLAPGDLTVIKKSPLVPPTLVMSNTSDGRFTSGGSTSLLTSNIIDCFINHNEENLEVGTIKNVNFASSPKPDYIVGDLILLRKNDSFEDDDISLDEFEIIVEIMEYNHSNGNAKIKINYIQTELVNDENALTTPIIFYSMLQQELPLYEFKFPKFAYRYKYQDNQYSTYSPFSEVAFLPGDFNYVPKEGYNLGMVNTLRSVYIMDFVSDEDGIPKDVVEIDILYKESNATNIYTVKTVKYGDDEWIAGGSVVNTLGGNWARTKGRVQITSEMVKAAVASNQILRPWDNVPRRAKAQEVVGNRIVYANYLQNYNL